MRIICVCFFVQAISANPLIGGSLSGTLTGVTGLLTQSQTQLTAALGLTLTGVTGTLVQLVPILSKKSGTLTILPPVTNTLSTISTFIASTSSEVTADTIKQASSLTFMTEALDKVFVSLKGTVKTINSVVGPVVGPVAFQVEFSLDEVYEVNLKLLVVSHAMLNASGADDGPSTVAFMAAVIGLFSAAFELVKSIQAAAAAVVALVAVAVVVVEAINALTVVLVIALQTVLTGIAKAAEIIPGLTETDLQIIAVVVAGLNIAVKGTTDIVAKITASLSGSGRLTSVTFIATSLVAVIGPLQEHITVIATLNVV